MCSWRVWLMWSIIDARVVVLPEPVAPVTSTRPRCSSASRFTPAGRLSCSKLGTSRGITRKRERDVAALAEGVDAEARQALGGVRDVEVAALVERLQLLWRDPGHRLERAEQVLLVQRWAVVERRDRAVATQHRRLVQLEVEVARAEFNGAPEEGIQVHRAVAEGIGRFGVRALEARQEA